MAVKTQCSNYMIQTNRSFFFLGTKNVFHAFAKVRSQATSLNK